MWQPYHTRSQFLQSLWHQLERVWGFIKQGVAVSALVIAMTAIAIATMGIMLGGPIALKKEGQFDEELIVLFMFLSYCLAHRDFPLPTVRPPHDAPGKEPPA